MARFHVVLPAIALLASLAAAQTVTTTVTSPTLTTTSAATTTSCLAESILNSCLEGTEAIANACSDSDYGCLCNQWSNVLVCYNNCPNDPGSSTMSASVSNYCLEASMYNSSTTKSKTATTTTGSKSSTSTTKSATEDAVTTSTVTATTKTATATATATATQSNAAAHESNSVMTSGTLMAALAAFLALV